MSLLFARFWPYVAGAALILAAFLSVRMIQVRLDEAQAQRDKAMVQLQVSNASIGALQSDIDHQNDAIANLDVEGEKRLEAGRALILKEVRAGARASQAAATLAAHPQTGGDQSRTSGAVLALRSDL